MCLIVKGKKDEHGKPSIMDIADGDIVCYKVVEFIKDAVYKYETYVSPFMKDVIPFGTQITNGKELRCKDVSYNYWDPKPSDSNAVYNVSSGIYHLFANREEAEFFASLLQSSSEEWRYLYAGRETPDINKIKCDNSNATSDGYAFLPMSFRRSKEYVVIEAVIPNGAEYCKGKFKYATEVFDAYGSRSVIYKKIEEEEVCA